MKLWSLLRPEKRNQGFPVVDQNALAEYFTFQGSAYPISGGLGGAFPFVTYDASSNKHHETIPNDFAGYVNAGYKSSGVVFACCLARQMVFTEVRFAFQKMNKGRPGDFTDENDRSIRLLRTPWPNGTTSQLLAHAIQDVDLCGNHYVLREDGPDGPRLRRLRPDWVSIVLTKSPEEALKSDVQGYIYKPGNTDDKTKWELFPADGSNGIIAHWAPIPDPLAQYRGMSWITPIIKEVLSDEGASTYKVNYFNNSAQPNLMVSFDPSVTSEQFHEFMTMMNQSKHGLQHAGETLYLGGGATVQALGSKIQEIDFSKLTSIAELRIAAAARVPPTVVGLTEGMRGSALNEGNYKAAADQFANGTIRPLWRDLCAAYAPLISVPANCRLWYDDRDIAFLQEDREIVATLQQTEAMTIARLVQEGYTPESVVKALIEKDWTLLEHSGLFSVQLMAPGLGHMTDYSGDAPTETLPPRDQQLAADPNKPDGPEPVEPVKPAKKSPQQGQSKPSN